MEKFNSKEADRKPVKGCEEEGGTSGGNPEASGCADTMTAEAGACDDNSARLAAEAREWEDKYLRLVAEFDNYRKRTLREKMELIAVGGEDVIKALLNVLDDIDRAMVAMEKVTDVGSMQEGIKLIHQKLMEVLRAKGLEEIEALGRELDTDLHEAVAKIPAEQKKMQGKIVDVVQKGYKLKDKVARHAKVVVGE